MLYFKPKPRATGVGVDWKVAKNVTEIVRYYAKYTGYTEMQIVNSVLLNLRSDPAFRSWVEQLRDNKKIKEYINADVLVGDEFIDENQTVKPTE